MKTKTFWLMFFIVVLGSVLRLIFIDKPDGLWNDEYVSWSIASIPMGKKFIEGVFFQCHMPFYYLYLKFFIHFFGNSDLMLRLTSVLPGILSIIAMYFVGREFRNEKLGVLCAAITALSSFLIYFSQEVRFYGLLFLFSSLSLIFTIRLLNSQDKRNFVGYVVSNFLIIFTHSIGFVFVLFNLIMVGYLLSKQNKSYKKVIIPAAVSLFLLMLLVAPLMFSIATSHPFSQWWGSFSLSKLGFLITDYFSPILTNLVSAPDKFFYNLSFAFVIFALIPSVIAILGVTKALLVAKNKSEAGEMNQSDTDLILPLFLLSLAFVMFLLVMALFGKLMFITKYSLEIYPILILVAAFGLLQFSSIWRQILIFIFCFLNLFYVLADKNSAPKMHRSEGHKIVANLISNAELNNGNFIVLTYYPKERFEKYFDFSKYNVVSVDKNTFWQYLGISSKEDLKTLNENHFYLEFSNKVLSKMKPNQKLSVVILKDVSVYSPMQISVLNKDEKEFQKTPFFFLAFSQVKNQILQISMKELKILRLEDKGSWMVVTFVKK